MPVYAPLQCPRFADLKLFNGYTISGYDWIEIDKSQAWRVCVNRYTSYMMFHRPLTESVYPSFDPMKLTIRIPPYCKGISFGVFASGQGKLYISATTAPASDPYSVTAEINTSFDDFEGCQWRQQPFTTKTGSEAGEIRPIKVASPARTWQSQSLSLYVSNDSLATSNATIYGLMWIPLAWRITDGKLGILS